MRASAFVGDAGGRLAHVAAHVATSSTTPTLFSAPAASAAVDAKSDGNGGGRMEEEDEETLVLRELMERVTSLDPATYLANRLTDEERHHYETEGFLVIRNAIESPSDLAELQELLGRMREQNLAAGKATPTQVQPPIHYCFAGLQVLPRTQY